MGLGDLGLGSLDQPHAKGGGIKMRYKDKTVNPIYKTTKWVKRVRPKVLTRDGQQCQNCKRFGKAERATTVHHVVPLSFDSGRAFDMENLVSLCAKCHGSFHRLDQGCLSQAGEQFGQWWIQSRAARLVLR